MIFSQEMNIIFISVNPVLIYVCIAISAVTALTQALMLLVQHNQSERLDKQLNELQDSIDRLKH